MTRRRKTAGEVSALDDGPWWLAAAALSGAVAFAAQQLLMRELLVIYSENALFAGLTLGLWLLIGGAAASAVRSGPWAERRVLATLLAQGLSVPLALLLCRAAWWAHPHRASLGDMMVICTVVVGAPAALAGALFTGLSTGRAAAPRVLAADCAGAIAGLALVLYGREHCVSPTALALTIAALPALWSAARAWRGSAPLAFAVPLALVAVSLAAAPALETATLAPLWKPLDIVLSLDTAWSRVTVARRPSFMGGTPMFFVNRFPMWAADDDAPHNEGLVHLPLLLHPAPKRVLIGGSGIGGNAREALKEPIQELVLCELEPAVLAAGRTLFAPYNGHAFDDPRLVALCTDVGRMLIEDPGTFDAILLDLPDPYLPQLARFYSRDFFALARRRLRPGGLLAIQLPPPSKHDSPGALANAHIAATFRAEFPDAVFVFGRMDYLVGFAGPPPPPDVMLQHFAQRGIPTRAVDAALLELNATGTRARAAREAYLAAAGPDSAPSTDDRPRALAYDLFFWEQVGNRGAALVPALLGGVPPFALALAGLALAAALWLAARRTWGPAFPLAAAGGLVTQALGTLALYQVQTRAGSLLATAPLLSAAALVGHGAGALVGTHLPRLRTVPLALALAGLAAAAPHALWAASPATVTTTGEVLLFLAGALAGALFPVLLAAGGAAGRLYAADLCGAALAAFLMLPVALPFVGVTGTALAAALTLPLAVALFRSSHK